MLPDKIVCGHCGYENSPDESRCANCGRSLNDNTTLMASGAALEIERPPVDLDGQPVDDDVLYFYVAGSRYHDPLLHRGHSSVILGRQRDESLEAEFIDLSGYLAYSLGVSRQHVRVSYHDDRYMVEDLGSANGTWLNGNRLETDRTYLLRRGDHLQLGELMVFVYFFHGS